MVTRVAHILFTCLFALAQAPVGLFADASDDQYDPSQRYQETQDTPQAFVEAPPVPTRPFDAFTGKIAKSKVRLRLQPNLEAPIIRELSQGDLLIVVGESDDYYAVQPPEGIKAYVFRTYVLDNVVEANKVNVRLEPNLDAPVVAQLSAGDKVDGTISALNSKWLEITPPQNTQFYVAKDFVENIGDTKMMGTITKRRNDVTQLLNTAYLTSQTEMQKEFPEINLDSIYANLNKVINQYPEFTEQANKARELSKILQEHYLQKKIAHLESRDKNTQEFLASKTSEMSTQVKSQQEKVSQLEQQLNRERAEKRNYSFVPPKSPTPSQPTSSLTGKMSLWVPIEDNLYTAWAQDNEQKPKDEFYKEQGSQAVVLHGILEPYNRVIKNKPGDYVLVNQANHLPIAYLYSTMVNLQDKVGQEVTVYGSPRPNNNFAFPSYFVLSAE